MKHVMKNGRFSCATMINSKEKQETQIVPSSFSSPESVKGPVRLELEVGVLPQFRGRRSFIRVPVRKQMSPDSIELLIHH